MDILLATITLGFAVCFTGAIILIWGILSALSLRGQINFFEKTIQKGVISTKKSELEMLRRMVQDAELSKSFFDFFHKDALVLMDYMEIREELFKKFPEIEPN